MVGEVDREAMPDPRDSTLIDRYLTMMAAERGASRNTLLAYRNDLEDASARIGGLGMADAARRGLVTTALGVL